MPRSTAFGLLLALVSAAAFATSGSLAKGLLAAGWSPGAAVTWRVAIGAAALAVPGILAMRGRWRRLRRGWPSVVLFGLLAVAGAQLAFFLAIGRLSVGVALLLEYCGVVLVVLWLWLRRGQRPKPLTLIGATVAIAGLVLVLNVFGAATIDLVGAMWGLVAATGLAAYFVISADERHDLPAMFVAAGGLAVGAVTLALAGALGILDMRWAPTDVTLAGATLPWWLDVAAMGLVAAALAYGSGIMANRILGSKLASFVGLLEVLFAILWARLLVAEMPAGPQLLGGALIMLGVVIVRLDERPRARVAVAPAQPGASSSSETGGADTVPAK